MNDQVIWALSAIRRSTYLVWDWRSRKQNQGWRSSRSGFVENRISKADGTYKESRTAFPTASERYRYRWWENY